MSKKPVTIFLLYSLFFIIFSFVVYSQAQQVNSIQTVYVIPLRGDIEPGLAEFVARGLNEARDGGADVVLFEITTFGGLVDSGVEIRDLIIDAELPTIAFVKNRALSAGALVALAAEHIVMAPGSTIGAAETRPKEEKYISAMRAEFRGAAERHGRDPQIAEAMVDENIEIEGIVRRGEILTLSASDAISLGFIDAVAPNRAEALSIVGYDNVEIVDIEMNWAERLARALTNPALSSILLTLGFAGIVIEFLTPGWGVPGSVGVLSLALFFGGRMVVGLAGWGIIFLFLIGILLLAMEIFVVPGFGVAGVSGIAVTLFSIGMTYADKQQAVASILISLIMTVVLIGIMLRYLPKTKTWGRIILSTKLDTSSGYIAQPTLTDLLGKTGKTITPLRPAGTIEIDDNRVDAVTEGGFIGVDESVRVVKVEGSRIVVRKDQLPPT